MPASKSAKSVLAAVATSQTSASIDCSTDYAQQLYVSIAIATAAAVAAPSFQPQYSPDGGTTWYPLPAYTAGTAIGSYYWVVDVPVTATNVEVVYSIGTVGTGGTHTCTAQLGQVTGV